ncbi:SDR family NAD(P)-dependent oxidoreductase [Mycobacterium sp. OTB74]|uniref:SDR family NAD(P)-dependent oxidoreductase n=1 Tax=Mycobacterium sp. OTB74 TaxID=1853452 RepID=UPI002472EF6B|nr:SDR family NAD(P)-dependent oxidoreductase [Mycobacterium sp. OTB74]MDH6243257.1 short-subunit dehydrogenase [Mycobacterium sp. OTB74]
MTATRTAVVTGASSGIGKATARRLIADGWEVLLVARRADRLDQLSGELDQTPWLALDLIDDDAPVRVAAEVDKLWHGYLGLLVNNAGMGGPVRFGNPDGGWPAVQRTMSLNFDATVRLTERLLPALRRGAPATVVNMSSIAGRIATPGRSAYSASKFALIGWSDALRAEERDTRVHVGCVLPGFIDTEGIPQSELLARSSTRWLVSKPDRVARAVTDLVERRKANLAVPRPWSALVTANALAPGAVAALTRRLSA